eukprot:753777-Hanusia_phi.AAC.8
MDTCKVIISFKESRQKRRTEEGRGGVGSRGREQSSAYSEGAIKTSPALFLWKVGWDSAMSWDAISGRAAGRGVIGGCHPVRHGLAAKTIIRARRWCPTYPHL